jgi:hypothetical protein
VTNNINMAIHNLTLLRIVEPDHKRKVELQNFIDYLRAWRDSESERGDK